MHSLIDKAVKVRVSSVLNKDAKQFGKQHMFDDLEETCWNSDQGNPQWIHLEFPHSISVSEIHIQFQGGFAGKECWLEANSEIGKLKKIQDIFPEDSNALQLPFNRIVAKR